MSPVRPTLLLHACCAPCATVPIERLAERWELKVLFYGPNIHPAAEHDRRLEEVRRLCRARGLGLLVEPGRVEDWEAAVAGVREEPERRESPRCRACFGLRLTRTARLARQAGCQAFTSSLSVGRLKNSPVLAEVGRAVARAEGVEFLAEDWKKRDGFGRALALGEALGLARQDYCGCAPSLAEVRARRARRPAGEVRG